MSIERFANCPTPQAPDTPWATLTSGIDAATTTIAVSSKTAFPGSVQFRIAIENERMLVTADAGGLSYTVQRGIEGTTAAAHSSGTGIFHVLTAGSLLNSPGAMTTEGDLNSLDSSGQVVRVPAGTFLTTAIAAATYLTTVAAAAAYVPTTRTVNGHALSANVTVSASDVGLGSVENAAASGLYVPLTRTVNGHALNANVTVSASDVGLGSVENAAASGLYVPLTRTVNGHALSANVTVTASDVGLGSVENAAASTLYQSLDADLTAIAALSGTGYAKRTGANTWTLDTPTVALPGDTQILFDDGGSFGGSANLTWDGDGVFVQGASGYIAAPYVTAQTVLLSIGVTALKETTIAATIDDTDAIVLRVSSTDGYSADNAAVRAAQFDAYSNASHVTQIVTGANFYGHLQNDALSFYGNSSQIYLGGHSIDLVYNYYVQPPNGSGSIGTSYGYYVAGGSGSATIANAYPFWSDEQGVFRIKADNTFNSVYQAIPALYNPQFTKYTPGATDHERVVIQWESNVATLRTESSGTGTLRALNLGGSSVTINGVAAVTTTGSQTLTNKSGNISQWTNDSAYLISVTAHNLLSATHGDTTAGTVTRGDVITGQGASATWKRLAIGSANRVLFSDGTDVSWSQVPIASAVSGLGTGVATFLATPSSANLASAITDETGSGALVFATSPTLTTPAIGVATGTRLTLSPSGAAGLTVTGATETTSQPLVSLTQTWNASGTTFDAFTMNVTASASAGASRLLRIQVSSSDRLTLTQGGTLAVSGSITTNNNIDIGNGWWWNDGANGASGGVKFGSGHQIKWNGSATLWSVGTAGSPDTGIARNAAGIVEINSATAGTFRDIKVRDIILTNGNLAKATVAFTNGAAAQAGTLTNAPAAGNPTKWIPVDDNGTTRYIPAW